MTLEELTQKYTDLPVNEDRLGTVFRSMGKFGPMFIYTFSFETESAVVSAEVCIKHGKMVGFTPEKEPRQDEWGFEATEEYTEAFTSEDCQRLDQYLASVLA